MKMIKLSLVVVAVLLSHLMLGCGDGHNDTGASNFPQTAEQASKYFNEAPAFIVSYYDEESVKEGKGSQINPGLVLSSPCSGEMFCHSIGINLDGKELVVLYVQTGIEIIHGWTTDGQYVLYVNGHFGGDIWGNKHFFLNGQEITLPFDIDFRVSDVRQYENDWLIVKMASGEHHQYYYVEDWVNHWAMYNMKTGEWIDLGVFGKFQ